MRRGIVVLNGDMNDYLYHRSLINDDNYIIAVDGGGKHLKELKIIPNFVCGDFDSLDPEILAYYMSNNVELTKYPTKKNYTDFELALDRCAELKLDEILVLGGFGGRMDMELGNIMTMISYSNNIKMISDKWQVCILSGKNSVKINGKIGDYISIIPVSTEVTGLLCQELSYPLRNLTLYLGKCRGISNEMLVDHVEIHQESGISIVYHQKKK